MYLSRLTHNQCICFREKKKISFPGSFQRRAMHHMAHCCYKKMKQKKLIDLFKDMRCCEICVLVLLSFQQMSIKHKKSLFPNISRDDNYHKSIFYATLNFHNVPLLTVTGGRLSLFVSMYDEHILELFHMYFAEFTASAAKNHSCFLRYLFPGSWLWFYSSDILWGIFFIFFFQFQSSLWKKYCFFEAHGSFEMQMCDKW